jgi:hypothetical protein
VSSIPYDQKAPIVREIVETMLASMRESAMSVIVETPEGVVAALQGKIEKLEGDIAELVHSEQRLHQALTLAQQQVAELAVQLADRERVLQREMAFSRELQARMLAVYDIADTASDLTPDDVEEPGA